MKPVVGHLRWGSPGVWLVVLCILAACIPTATAPAVQERPGTPEVQLVEMPDIVCQATTQIRLRTVLSGFDGGGIAAQWSLVNLADSAVLSLGDWDLQAGEIFIAFPDGKPLEPGEYDIQLAWQTTPLLQRRFVVSAEAPRIADLYVSEVPLNDAISRFDEGTLHFYVNFAYQHACQGAPYWLKVYRGDELLCTTSNVLLSGEGTGSYPCYLPDGASFPAGDYRVVFTLSGEAEAESAFEMRSIPPSPTPAPTATTTPQPLVCDQLFTASGLTPQGDPYLPLVYFDWYVQAIYAGRRCEHLIPGTVWRSAWYRDGQVVRKMSQTWDGPAEGLVWDSITGIPGDPFVYPGTYTVTLEIDNLLPQTIEFRVIPYVRPDTDQ